MPTTSPDKDEGQIRECLNRWTRALHARDLNALMALYAPDTIAFDLMPPSQVDARHYRQPDADVEVAAVEVEEHQSCC